MSTWLKRSTVARGQGTKNNAIFAYGPQGGRTWSNQRRLEECESLLVGKRHAMARAHRTSAVGVSAFLHINNGYCLLTVSRVDADQLAGKVPPVRLVQGQPLCAQQRIRCSARRAAVAKLVGPTQVLKPALARAEHGVKKHILEDGLFHQPREVTVLRSGRPRLTAKTTPARR